MGTRACIDELSIDANLVAACLLAPLQRIAHPELSSDLLYVNGLALVGECRAACDHEAVANTGEAAGQLLRDDVRQVILRRVAAQIGEGQHDQGEPRGRAPPLWTSRDI